MDLISFIVVVFALQAVCVVVGKRASKKCLKDPQEYFLAGRGVKFFPLMMTLIATQIGGGLVLGAAEESFHYGWSVILYPLGASLGMLALAFGIGKRMAAFSISTVAQIFEVVYQSKVLKKVASLLSIVSLFLILVAQVIASKKFMVGLGVQDHWFLLCWGLVIFYTVMGGLRGVVATDIIQAVFFIGVFVLCFAYTWWNQGTLAAPATDWSQGFDFDPSKLWGWLLMPLCFMVIEQDMGQRCFAARSGKVVSWASGCTALCTMTICMIPVFYGILGRYLGVTPEGGSSVLMAVVNISTTPFLSAMMGGAILAAIISTAESLINAIGSNVVQDFNCKIFQGKKNFQSSRLMTLIISLVALAVSFSFTNVVDLLILSYELSVSCLFVPIFVALFVRRGNFSSAVYSIILGGIGFIFFRFISFDFLPKEVGSLLFSSIGFAIGEIQAKYFSSEELSA